MGFIKLPSPYLVRRTEAANETGGTDDRPRAK
jgi:hypothetical protein